MISLVIVCSLPLKEMRTAGAENTGSCRIDGPEDTITEFVGGQKKEIDPHEVGGVVYDTSGAPLKGVLVDVWTWYSKPGNEVYTDSDGKFRLSELSGDEKVEVRFSKEGYSPKLIVKQETGIGNIKVTLGNKTYFEGNVLSEDGSPVPNALIRANQGPKQADGVVISSIWTETQSKSDGSYRLYVEADTYDIQVKAAGVGVTRMQDQTIFQDRSKHLDIHLEEGITFHAIVLNSETEQPVKGVRLSHWQHKGVEGISDEKGILEITDMFPGPFEFQVEGKGISRWWSEDAINKHQQKMISKKSGWQRNFDNIEFNIKKDMEPVTIYVENAVTVTGRVVDPNGNPVAGATVAPAHTGTGNSITGDTRFSVSTNESGNFVMYLPASGKSQYNLVAHDGAYSEWRTWANGVMEPIQTKPGDTINDVTIHLNRICTVRGTVKDKDGNPVAGNQVRAHAADLKANRYYDPTSRTDENGNFELRFIRPGKHYIQTDPFFLVANEAPDVMSKMVELESGEAKEGIELVTLSMEDINKTLRPK